MVPFVALLELILLYCFPAPPCLFRDLKSISRETVTKKMLSRRPGQRVRARKTRMMGPVMKRMRAAVEKRMRVKLRAARLKMQHPDRLWISAPPQRKKTRKMKKQNAEKKLSLRKLPRPWPMLARLPISIFPAPC